MDSEWVECVNKFGGKARRTEWVGLNTCYATSFCHFRSDMTSGAATISPQVCRRA